MKKVIGWFGIGIAVLMCVLVGFGIVASKRTDEEWILVEDSRFPTLHIVHLSDLHFPENGIPLEEVTKRVKSNAPDYIFLTGDIIQDGLSEDNFPTLQKFLRTLATVAPCYAVLGNHEIGYQNLEKLCTVIKESGVNLLKNEVKKITARGKTFLLGGLSDAYPLSALSMTASEKKYPLLLLAHRPDKIKSYCDCENSSLLVFCGHAHGGAVRVGQQGLYAPDQGFFPAYTSGLYEVGKVKMIVSRGLGKEKEIRLFNAYHLPIIRIGAGC